MFLCIVCIGFLYILSVIKRLTALKTENKKKSSDVLENITLPCPKTPYTVFFQIREKISMSCLFTYYITTVKKYSTGNVLFSSRLDVFLSRNSVPEILGMQFLIAEHS